MDALDHTINDFSQNPFLLNQALSFYFLLYFIHFFSALEFKDKIIHKKYIVLITDGFNQPGKSNSQNIMRKFFSNKINLISICYSYNSQNLEFLENLSNSTTEGILIDLNSLNKIDFVFESMNEKLQGKF